jgi:hypothetical protein
LASFIYCTDETTKNELISKGYKFITTQQLNNQLTWVFENKTNLQFDIKNTKKCFINNTLMF